MHPAFDGRGHLGMVEPEVHFWIEHYYECTPGGIKATEPAHYKNKRGRCWALFGLGLGLEDKPEPLLDLETCLAHFHWSDSAPA